MCANIFSVYLFSVLVVQCVAQLGDKCTHQQRGASGECKLLADCNSAYDDAKNRGIFPQNCGFKGTQPIVCCVEEKREEPKKYMGQISEAKCREYSKFAYTKEPSPVLLIGVKMEEVSSCSFQSQELIIGGEDAAPKEFPHMALIGYGETNVEWSCGGTLISELYVLSAAHCISRRDIGAASRVRLGDLNTQTQDDDAKPQEIGVAQRIRHPDYDGRSRYHDILLLKLERPAELNTYVRPACLYPRKTIPSRRFIATGWGYTENGGNPSDVLQKVVLEEFSTETCNASFRNSVKVKRGIFEDLQICAGSTSGRKDTCQGDSGGPLQIYNKDVECTYYIVGVTSFGKQCGFENVPAIYTRVSRYLEWIEGIVWA